MLVFVYGTLTDPERVASVVETFEFVGDATLVGLHRVDGRYPTLAPGGQTDGKLLETPEMDALDSYEGVARGLYDSNCGSRRQWVVGAGRHLRRRPGQTRRIGGDFVARRWVVRIKNS